MTRYFTRLVGPLGPITLRARDARDGERLAGPVLTGLFFADDPRGDDPELVRDDERLAPLRAVVEAYLAGRTRSLELAWDLDEGTPFQREVWRALARIPYGSTWSYAELARAVERPRAVRAVGAANGRNPLSIVLPCHRVIGADGRLVGYGGGLPLKEHLLALEGAWPRGARDSSDARTIDPKESVN